MHERLKRPYLLASGDGTAIEDVGPSKYMVKDRKVDVHAPFIWVFSDMVCSCARTIYFNIYSTLRGNLAQDGFTNRRSTDVAEADDKDLERHNNNILRLLCTESIASCEMHDLLMLPLELVVEGEINEIVDR